MTVSPLIPQLPGTTSSIGEAGRLKRNFPFGSRDFIRVYCGESIDLEIEVRDADSHCQVFLHSNINSQKDWQDLSFEQNPTKPELFTLQLKTTQAGQFSFRIKYQVKKNGDLIWDRVPYTRVMVDPSKLKTLRLYTFIPNVSGTIDQWFHKIDHIAEMGFNAIHFLPITTHDKSQSPYSAAQLFNLDPSYLSDKPALSSQVWLEKLVEHCKKKEIALFFDLVLNHIGINSDLAEKCPHWIMPDKTEPDGKKRAGCWHMNAWIKWEDLAKINYDHPSDEERKNLWHYMQQYSAYWAFYAAQTGGGIRFDNLHSSHELFIEETCIQLRDQFPELILFAEFFADNNTLLKRVPEWGLNLLLGNPWEYPFVDQLEGYIDYQQKIYPGLKFLTMPSSHDTGAPAQLYGDAKALIARYAVCALLSAGLTGIVQGSEYLHEEKIEFIGLNQSLPYNEEHNSTINKITQINHLLETEPTFSDLLNLRLVFQENKALLAGLRQGEKTFLIIANFDPHRDYLLEVSSQSLGLKKNIQQITDVFSQKTLYIENGVTALNLAPLDVQVLKLIF